jgi:hypothetical protein
MFQIKGLASCLKGFTQSKIITDIALRHKRKLFCKYDNIWYEFPNSGAIIIPFDVANEYAKKHKLLLEEPLALNNIDFSYLNKTVNRIPVVAILGHFNHGKTTLIDAYAGTNLVQQEIHAITQVKCFFVNQRTFNNEAPHCEGHTNENALADSHDAASFACNFRSIRGRRCDLRRHPRTGNLLQNERLWCGHC